MTDRCFARTSGDACKTSSSATGVPGTLRPLRSVARLALSDKGLALRSLLRLPTFRVAGMELYQRLTLVAADRTIEGASIHSFRQLELPTLRGGLPPSVTGKRAAGHDLPCVSPGHGPQTEAQQRRPEQAEGMLLLPGRTREDTPGATRLTFG